MKLRDSEAIEFFLEGLEEDYAFLEIEDLIVQVKKGDSYQDVVENHKRRSKITKLRREEELAQRVITGKNNLIKRMEKADSNDTKEILLVLKQAIRHQDIDTFEYRRFLDIFKGKNFEVKHSSDVNMDDETEVFEFIFNQSIKSLEENYFIHPKIRHAIRDIEKKFKELES